MSDRLRISGEEYLASLLDMAKELAELRAENQPATTHKGKKNKQPLSAATPFIPPSFTEEDVVSDEEFIRRTRSYIRSMRESPDSPIVESKYEGYDIYAEEGKRLFWANGGERYMRPFGDYGTAFDNLRAEKLRAVSKQSVISPAPTAPQRVRVLRLPGTPTQRKWKAQQAAERVAKARMEMGFDHE